MGKTAATLLQIKVEAQKCTSSYCILYCYTLMVKRKKNKKNPVSLRNVLDIKMILLNLNSSACLFDTLMGQSETNL